MVRELDLKDKKILYELDKNARINLSELGKKVKLSKEVVFHRLNNLIDDKVILRFHTVTASYRFGLTAYKVYLKLFDISEEQYDNLVKYLLNEKNVFWIGTSKGRWDLMFGIWATDVEEFFKIQDPIIDKFSKFILEKELSISRRNIQYNRRWMYYSDLKPVVFDFGETESKVELDNDDKKILDILVGDSRTKIIDIAKETGISADMVSYRIKKMEKDKIIRGYKCLFNSKELGYVTCKSFVYFKNINEEKKRAFLEYCKMIPQTINIVVTFAPWDLEVMFEVNNFEQFYTIMEDIKEKFKDVVKFYDGLLITSEPKQIFMK